MRPRCEAPGFAGHPDPFNRCRIRTAGRSTVLLLLILIPATLLTALACDNSSRRPAGRSTPVSATATVVPMALVLSAVGVEQVNVVSFVPPGQRIHHFRDRGDPSLAYQPDPDAQVIFRQSELLMIAGRSDQWALAGFSNELATAAAGPTIRLDRLPSAQIHEGQPGGAPWLDPLVLSDAAAEVDRRLQIILGEPSAARSDRAGGLQRRLRSLVEARAARFEKVLTVSNEPLALLRRLEIEPVTLLPGRSWIVPPLEEIRAAIERESPDALLLPTDWAAETADEWSAELGLPVVLYDPTGTRIADRLDPMVDVGVGVGVGVPSGRLAQDLLVEWLRFNVENLTVSRSAAAVD